MRVGLQSLWLEAGRHLDCLARSGNARILAFWRDERGVALAMTVVMFLSLFVISGMVYAVGETLRQRVILQNAADSAAYSAAVVQANAISRVAALNRAMAWTYVQMCRRQMDYIVHVWLRRALDEFLAERNMRLAHYYRLFSGGNCHTPWRQKDWWIGEASHRDHMRLNKSQWVHYQEIQAQVSRFDFAGVRRGIEEDWQMANDLGDAEAAILGGLPRSIRSVVARTVKANSSEPRATISWAVLQSSNPRRDCFSYYDIEKKFFYAANTTMESLGNGYDTWFPGRPPDGGLTWERFRDYTQQDNCLIAEWKSFVKGWTAWVPCRHCGRHHVGWVEQTYSTHWGGGGVKAEQVRDKYFTTVVLRPLRLEPEFFARGGAIVVGVSRPVENPFATVFGAAGTQGIYRAYSPRVSFPQWAVAAARAGIKDVRGGEGCYNSSIDSAQIDYRPPKVVKSSWQRGGWVHMHPYNLCETDWDAILLPLSRAWSSRSAAWVVERGAGGGGYESGYWKDDGRAAIMSELWRSAPWTTIDPAGSFSGLRSRMGSAPAGGVESATVDRALEGKELWH